MYNRNLYNLINLINLIREIVKAGNTGNTEVTIAISFTNVCSPHNVCVCVCVIARNLQNRICNMEVDASVLEPTSM